MWRSGSDNVERSYGYKYDALNRLTNAIYGKLGNSVKLTHNYNEWLTYDKNGNILTLDRNGISESYLIKIDQLNYEYANNNSNLLVKVTDDTNNAAGFKKGNPTSDNDFTYDDNGNLIADKNKNITQIIYNHLNLPTKITFNGNANQYITYLYNATGQKIQKTIKNTDSLSTTHYINGFQYFDNVLQFFPTPEGYVKNTPMMSGGYSFDYVYNYTDHLGNIRLSYTQDPQTGALAILEENHYYPFGLQHKNYNSDITKIDLLPEQNNEKGLKEAAPPSVPLQNPGYMYKYNGKELQNEFGVEMYDFGARNYDPAIGRWMNVDPLAEDMRRHSPYNFAFNNPIYFIDPDGMAPKPSEDDNEESLRDRVNAIAQMTRVNTSGNDALQVDSLAGNNSSEESGDNDSESDDSSSSDGGGCDDPPCFDIWESIKNAFSNPLKNSKEEIDRKGDDIEITQNLIAKAIDYFGTALEFQIEAMTLPIGGPGKGFVAKNVLQFGGQTLKPGTLKTLNLTKEQGRNAIHALKSDSRLPNDFHGIIMKNGDYLNPTTKAVIENIFNFVY